MPGCHPNWDFLLEEPCLDATIACRAVVAVLLDRMAKAKFDGPNPIVVSP